MPIEQVLRDSNLLERLIIIDMKKKPYNYINLVKARVFNAHLCNIGNNPFEKKVYITEEQLHRLGYWKYGKFDYNRENKFEGLKTNRVNYSLLEALLKNIITDKNISIIDCENLYRKFGFECNPILVNIGQQCVIMILNEVKGSQEYINVLKESEKKEKNNEEQYCKIDFEGLVYEFENENTDIEKLFNEVISKRNIELSPSTQKKKFFSKTRETIKKEDTIQEKKEKINTEGSITKDIDIIVLLIKDIIEQYNEELSQLIEKLEQESQKENKETSYSLWSTKLEIERYEERIKSEQNRIQWLEELKDKNEKLTLEETRKLLLTINDVYSKLHIKHNIRKLLPLEDMGSENSKQVYLAPIPEENGTYKEEVSHSFFGSQYEDRYYHKSDLKPLWKRYKMEFRDLGIDVKKYSQYFGGKPHFEICVNLDDISDLPIDYEKVKLLTKEELQEIIEKEEGNER